jgi:excisionase family DNA binding protein
MPSREPKSARQLVQQPIYIGVPDAATYLDVDHKTIRRMIQSGRLPAYRLGNRVVKIKVADLEASLTPIGPDHVDEMPK